MAEHTSYGWMLTGRFCYVRGWFGGLVLQVEEWLPELHGRGFKRPEMYRWRKAKFSDLQKLNGIAERG